MAGIKELLLRMGDVITSHPKRRPLDGSKLVPDPRPLEPPVGYKKQPSMVEVVRNMVRSESLRQAALSRDAETFEEADDFDVGDDFDPTSPYEEIFDPVERELDRRLTDAEFGAKVRERLAAVGGRFEEEHPNGDRRSIEGRVDVGSVRAGRDDTQREGKSGAKPKPDHARSVSDADKRD